MFSDVSKLFDRASLTATFLPATFFLAIQFLLLRYVASPTIALYRDLQTLSTIGKISAFVVTVAIAAVLLQLLNRSIIRLLEGYPLRRWVRPSRQIKKFHKLRHDINAYQNGTEEFQADPANKARYGVAMRDFPRCFPGEERLVLPTKLGNVMRAYEYYPTQVYNIEAVATWPRLMTVIPKEYLAQIEAEESSLDFFVNCTVLFFLATLELLPIFALTRHWTTGLGAALTLILVPCSYQGAVMRAGQRGEVVKSYFDAFRLDLLKQMGYRLPKSLAEEREMWDALGSTFAFALEPNLPYADEENRETIKEEPEHTSKRRLIDVLKGIVGRGSQSRSRQPPADSAQ